LDLNDGLGLEQALAQPLDLALQLRHPSALGINRATPTTALAWCQRRQGTGLALAPPGGQVRGVKALTAQQGADLPGLAVVGLLQHLELVLGRKPPAAGLLHHLGVGSDRHRGARAGGCDSSRPTGSFRLIPQRLYLNLLQSCCHR
jgi:hypothetical protein